MAKFSLEEFVQSSIYKNFSKKVYGFGAAIVIIGALFKILHIPGGSPVLVLGMGTEALIFIMSAFEPLDEELDWTLVYPELAGVEPDEDAFALQKEANRMGGTSQNNYVPEGTFVAPRPGNGGGQVPAEEVGKYATWAESAKSDMNNLQIASQNLSKLYEHQANNIEKGQKYYDLIGESTPEIGTLSQIVKVFSFELDKTMADVSNVSKSMNNFSEQYESITQRMEAKSMELDDIDKHNKKVMAQYAQVQEELSGFKNSLSTLNKYYSNMLANTHKAKKQA